MSSDTPTPEDDQRFAREVGTLLRESAEQVDPATSRRLKAARAAALAELPVNRRLIWWVPAMSAAAVGAVAVGVWLGSSPPGTPEAAPDPLVALEAESQDLEILLAGSELEMIEDVDFYAWADAELSADELGAELDGAG